MNQATDSTVDPTAAKLLNQWKYEPSPLIACRFSPLGKHVFAGARENHVLRLNLESGEFVPLVGHDSWVRAIGFAAAGARCWTGGYDGALIEWDANADKPKPLRKLEAHQGWIRWLDVSADQKLLATGGNDHAVRVWDTESGKLVHECKAHDRHVYSVLFDAEGKTLFSGDLRGVVKRWDMESGSEMATLDAAKLYTANEGQGAEYGGVRSMTLETKSGELVCGGLHKGTNPFGAIQEPLVVVLNAADGTAKRIHTAKGDPKCICWRVMAHPQGFLMGGCGGNAGGLVCFWKPDSETEFHRFQLPNFVYDMDLSADGKQLVTAHYDRHIRVSQLS